MAIALKADYFLFTDASFDPESGRGVGAMLILSKDFWAGDIDTEKLPIQTQVLQEPNIARCELATALWTLNTFEADFLSPESIATPPRLHLYTDCKTLAELPARRPRLIAKEFKSKKTGEKLLNADLYLSLYKVFDDLNPKIIWMEGHSPQSKKSDIAKVFAAVDKAARAFLRQSLTASL